MTTPTKNFVLTGTLSEKRDDVVKRIEDAGGQVLGSVSKKVDYLVIGEKPGSKLAKAENLDIQIIDECKLNDLLDDLN